MDVRNTNLSWLDMGDIVSLLKEYQEKVEKLEQDHSDLEYKASEMEERIEALETENEVLMQENVALADKIYEMEGGEVKNENISK